MMKETPSHLGIASLASGPSHPVHRYHQLILWFFRNFLNTINTEWQVLWWVPCARCCGECHGPCSAKSMPLTYLWPRLCTLSCFLGVMMNSFIHSTAVDCMRHCTKTEKWQHLSQRRLWTHCWDSTQKEVNFEWEVHITLEIRICPDLFI